MLVGEALFAPYEDLPQWPLAWFRFHSYQISRDLELVDWIRLPGDCQSVYVHKCAQPRAPTDRFHGR